MASVSPEQKVLSPEGDQPRLRAAARQACHTVAMETTARDHMTAGEGGLGTGRWEVG